ncbi:hypothetical protein, partial [Sulfobacillus thermosulfidooxidans]|uniref:hypothetical protein n=1 Tax=Sulfobacillus thermosulfidooxidans TaxID=28034 RepID=UPI00138AC823
GYASEIPRNLGQPPLSATPMQVVWIRIAEIVPGMMVGLFADRWPGWNIMGMVDVVVRDWSD